MKRTTLWFLAPLLLIWQLPTLSTTIERYRPEAEESSRMILSMLETMFDQARDDDPYTEKDKRHAFEYLLGSGTILFQPCETKGHIGLFNARTSTCENPEGKGLAASRDFTYLIPDQAAFNQLVYFAQHSPNRMIQWQAFNIKEIIYTPAPEPMVIDALCSGDPAKGKSYCIAAQNSVNRHYWLSRISRISIDLLSALLASLATSIICSIGIRAM